MNNIFKNTFELFGDENKCAAQSKRDYALAYLPMFERSANGEYRITELRHEERVGSSNEIRWMDRVLSDCHDIKTDEDNEPTSGLISETRLLDYLVEAVEEVQ